MKHVVYLHGFASSPASSKARYFRQLLERAGATVTIPDLAAGDFEHMTIASQLDVIDKAVKGAPVAMAGSSLGGYLAALYASRHPEVSKLVLLAPAFCFSQRWNERLGEAEIDQWRRDGSMPVFHYGENRTVPIRYQFLAEAAAYEDYPPFEQPALIFHGIDDDIVPVRYSQELARQRPGITLDVVDSGHDLINVLDYMGPKVSSFLLD